MSVDSEYIRLDLYIKFQFGPISDFLLIIYHLILKDWRKRTEI